MAFIGTAGWSISATHAHAFPGSGTHLERYGAVLQKIGEVVRSPQGAGPALGGTAEPTY